MSAASAWYAVWICEKVSLSRRFRLTAAWNKPYGRDTHSVDDRSHTPPSARIIHKTNQLVETPNLEKP